MLSVEVTKLINAPVDDVYAVIADYREGHKAILPQPYFKKMEVLKGGYGAGTETDLLMEVYGQQTRYHQVITEPVPGRVIREQDQLSSQYSEFRLEPVGDGTKTQVTIFSEMPIDGGIKGLMQQWFQPRIVRKIFAKELDNLENYLSQQGSGASGPVGQA